MKTIMLCVLALLILPGGLLLAQDIAGDWQGTLNGPPGGLRAILKISKSDAGWSGQFYSIDQGPDAIPVTSITLSGSDFKLSVDAIHGTYAGTLSVDGNTIDGTWNQGKPQPLILKRATPQTAWAIDPSKHSVQFIAVDPGVKLEVLDWGGTGRPLILLAGLGNTAHVFDHLAPKLISSYHVYGITRRGFGLSSAPVPTDDNYDADRLGDDVLAVIATLKLDRPIVAGHSIAGEELSSIGSRYPEKVAGLIYLDAAFAYAFYDPAQSSSQNLIVDAADLKRKLDNLVTSSGPREQEAALKEINEFVLPQFEKDLKMEEDELAKTPEPTSGTMVASRPEMPAIAKAIIMSTRKYTSIKGPVLAICAVPHDVSQYFANDPAGLAAAEASDLALTTAQANAFQKGVPSAHVVRLAHADHYVFNSNEGDVLREIKAFTATLP